MTAAVAAKVRTSPTAPSVIYHQFIGRRSPYYTVSPRGTCTAAVTSLGSVSSSPLHPEAVYTLSDCTRPPEQISRNELTRIQRRRRRCGGIL